MARLKEYSKSDRRVLIMCLIVVSTFLALLLWALLGSVYNSHQFETDYRRCKQIVEDKMSLPEATEYMAELGYEVRHFADRYTYHTGDEHLSAQRQFPLFLTVFPNYVVCTVYYDKDDMPAESDIDTYGAYP